MPRVAVPALRAGRGRTRRPVPDRAAADRADSCRRYRSDHDAQRSDRERRGHDRHHPAGATRRVASGRRAFGRVSSQAFIGEDLITIVASPGPIVTLHNDGSGYTNTITTAMLDGTLQSYTLASCVDSVTDLCGNPISVNSAGNITKITNDETFGTQPSMVINSNSSFQVRRQRAGSGDGRVYGTHFTVTDSLGNSTSAVCKVQVWHDAAHTAVESPPVLCVGACP
jgi:hypothetical protein